MIADLDAKGGALFPDVANPGAAEPGYPFRHSTLSRHQNKDGWDGGKKYNVVGTAGKGAFATVLRIATKQEGHVYAAKEISKRQLMKNGIYDRKIDSELHIMQRLRHVSISILDETTHLADSRIRITSCSMSTTRTPRRTSISSWSTSPVGTSAR